MLTTVRTNPYHDDATRDLKYLPSVRQAYAYARNTLQTPNDDGGQDAH